MAAHISYRVATLNDYSAKPSSTKPLWGLEPGSHSHAKHLWYDWTLNGWMTKFIEIASLFIWLLSFDYSQSRCMASNASFQNGYCLGQHWELFSLTCPQPSNVSPLYQRKQWCMIHGQKLNKKYVYLKQYNSSIHYQGRDTYSACWFLPL